MNGSKTVCAVAAFCILTIIIALSLRTILQIRTTNKLIVPPPSSVPPENTTSVGNRTFHKISVPANRTIQVNGTSTTASPTPSSETFQELNTTTSSTVLPTQLTVQEPTMAPTQVSGDRQQKNLLAKHSVTLPLSNKTIRIFHNSHKLFIEREGLIFEFSEHETRQLLQILAVCIQWDSCPGKNQCQPLQRRHMKMCYDNVGRLTGLTYNNVNLLSKTEAIKMYMWASSVFSGLFQ